MGACYGAGMLWISALGDFSSLRDAFAVAAVVAGVSAFVVAMRVPGWRDVVDGKATPVEYTTVSA
jgi:hypothetical protein